MLPIADNNVASTASLSRGPNDAGIRIHRPIIMTELPRGRSQSPARHWGDTSILSTVPDIIGSPNRTASSPPSSRSPSPFYDFNPQSTAWPNPPRLSTISERSTRSLANTMKDFHISGPDSKLPEVPSGWYRPIRQRSRSPRTFREHSHSPSRNQPCRSRSRSRSCVERRRRHSPARSVSWYQLPQPRKPTDVPVNVGPTLAPITPGLPPIIMTSRTPSSSTYSSSPAPIVPPKPWQPDSNAKRGTHYIPFQGEPSRSNDPWGAPPQAWNSWPPPQPSPYIAPMPVQTPGWQGSPWQQRQGPDWQNGPWYGPPPVFMPQEPFIGPKVHPRFHFNDGNMSFQCGEFLYNIHRYHFQQLSSYAVPPFNLLPGCDNKGLDLILDIMYPKDYLGTTDAQTVDDWTTVLSTAAQLELQLLGANLSKIRALAVEKLRPIASLVDKITLGKQFGINLTAGKTEENKKSKAKKEEDEDEEEKVISGRDADYLVPLFTELCTRVEPLSTDEGKKLGKVLGMERGLEAVVEIEGIRQALRKGIKEMFLEDN
ncbi:hypothetical protein C8J56DRAFT_285180 [Mycena floridula]|nr:hypothetical protein C8J56DRAFT_285180 [Mycena floridula]